MADANARHDSHGRFAEDPDRADKELIACEMRRDGFTFRAIGKKLGISESAACRIYQAVQQRTRALADEVAEDLRLTELERLDRSIEKLTPLLDDPEQMVRAAEVLDKLSASRRKLLGLDAPTRQELTGKDGAPIAIDDRRALADRIAGLVAGEAAGSETGKDT